jgi:hypothetical protein
MRPQRCILRNLGSPSRFIPTLFTSRFGWFVLFPARAYVLSSNLNPDNLPRAETALNELLDSIPSDDVSIHQTRALLLSPRHRS